MEVVTFVNFRPPPRFDAIAWTGVLIDEAPADTGPWVQIDSIPLSPVDVDPSQPQLRSFTTEKGTALDYWYRVTFRDATGDVSQPTTPIQNTAGAAASYGPYTTVAELQRVLQKPSPTAAEQTAMQRTIDNAAREIDWDLSYDSADTPAPPPGPADLAILAEVNLARAVELWNIEFRPFGQLPAGPDAFPILAARDSWYRHHLRLNPLRVRFPVG